ncbi:MAG: hypothetical protein H0W61_02680 [Bacteroidetes bacterium]|nr:hypothetical protein [Bacteroidota bacterium]
MKSFPNYKKEEAQNLKNTYTSWIGRDAHTGNGKKKILKDINISQDKLLEPLTDSAVYKVDFIFEGNTVLDAYEFLSYNSLIFDDASKNTADKNRGSAA